MRVEPLFDLVDLVAFGSGRVRRLCGRDLDGEGSHGRGRGETPGRSGRAHDPGTAQRRDESAFSEGLDLHVPSERRAPIPTRTGRQYRGTKDEEPRPRAWNGW